MNAIVVTTKSFGIGHIRNDDHFEIAMTLKKIYGLIFVSSKLINEVCGPFNTISVGFAVVSLLSDSYQIFLYSMSKIAGEDVLGEWNEVLEIPEKASMLLSFSLISEPIHDLIFALNLLIWMTVYSSIVYRSVRRFECFEVL
jgi:hypothetical protein